MSASAQEAGIVWWGRLALLWVITMVFVGVMPFLITISPVLLYAVYAVIFGAGALLLVDDWANGRRILPMLPYLVWLLGYCYWGTLVADEALPLGEVVKLYVKHVAVFGAFCLFVKDRESLGRLSNWIQAAAVLNALIAVWGAIVPELNADLALMADPEANAFSLTRPAGLWRNPDEAATAFIFSFLVAHWAGRPWKWIGRLAAGVGIFLGASRTGAYVLVLCGVLYGFMYWRTNGFSLGAVWRSGLALVMAIFVGLLFLEVNSGDITVHEQEGRLSRILDFRESGDRGLTDPTRGEIAHEAIDRFLSGPWYGNGIFSFQVEPHLPTVLDIGAHNVYITVWGETGYLGLASYLALIGLGLWRVGMSDLHVGKAHLGVGKAHGPEASRRILWLMWISYLIIGLTWHNQFTSFSGMLYVAMLWHIPAALSAREAIGAEQSGQLAEKEGVPA